MLSRLVYWYFKMQCWGKAWIL